MCCRQKLTLSQKTSLHLLGFSLLYVQSKKKCSKTLHFCSKLQMLLLFFQIVVCKFGFDVTWTRQEAWHNTCCDNYTFTSRVVFSTTGFKTKDSSTWLLLRLALAVLLHFSLCSWLENYVLKSYLAFSSALSTCSRSSVKYKYARLQVELIVKDSLWKPLVLCIFGWKFQPHTNQHS